MINYIQTFLERIPAIDRCCDAVKDTRSKQLMPDIYHVSQSAGLPDFPAR